MNLQNLATLYLMATTTGTKLCIANSNNYLKEEAAKRTRRFQMFSAFCRVGSFMDGKESNERSLYFEKTIITISGCCY